MKKCLEKMLENVNSERKFTLKKNYMQTEIFPIFLIFPKCLFLFSKFLNI